MQLLPEIVDLSQSAQQPPAPNADDHDEVQQTSPSRHEDDTSNDILSDFSEDLLAADGSGSRVPDPPQDDQIINLTRSIEKTLRDLGLASSGYLGENVDYLILFLNFGNRLIFSLRLYPECRSPRRPQKRLYLICARAAPLICANLDVIVSATAFAYSSFCTFLLFIVSG